jgi:hypothetical protein
MTHGCPPILQMIFYRIATLLSTQSSEKIADTDFIPTNNISISNLNIPLLDFPVFRGIMMKIETADRPRHREGGSGAEIHNTIRL